MHLQRHHGLYFQRMCRGLMFYHQELAAKKICHVPHSAECRPFELINRILFSHDKHPDIFTLMNWMIPLLTIQRLSSVSYRVSLILYVAALVCPIKGVWFAGVMLFTGTLLGSVWFFSEPEFYGLFRLEILLPFYNVVYFMAAYRFRESIFAERLSLLEIRSHISWFQFW